MAEKVLYGHSSGSNGTGYRILSRSASNCPVRDLDVNALIQRLKLRPAILGSNIGWFWLPFSRQARVLAAALACTNDDGVQTLQFRLVFFPLDECDRFQWQPFHYLGEMLSQSRWEVGDDGTLPGLVQGPLVESAITHASPVDSFTIGWNDSASVADRVLAAFLSSSPLKERRSIEFLAPELTHQDDPLVVFRANSSASLSSARTESASSSERAFDFKTVVLSGVIAVLLGFAVAFALFQKKLEEKNALLADRDSELRQYENDLASPTSQPTVHDQSIAVSNLDSEFAKSTLARLRTLFDKLYSESYAVTIEHETASLMHYLDNKGESNEYDRLVASGLEAWIELEERLNSEQDRTAEQLRVSTQLRSTLQELRSLVRQIDRFQNSSNSRPRQEQKPNLQDDIETTANSIRQLLDEVQATFD